MADSLTELTKVLNSNAVVRGSTHGFYRYPARFSPDFVRFVIAEFSHPGDVVFDPFMGGGTTIVEALASGRRAVGVDINTLAHFVTRVKTTPLSQADGSRVLGAVSDIESAYRRRERKQPYRRDARIRNLPSDLEEFFAIAKAVVRNVPMARRRAFLRCALLGVGQWALESRDELPAGERLMMRLQEHTSSMLEGLDSLVLRAQQSGVYKQKLTGYRQLVRGSAADPKTLASIQPPTSKPRLVLTSPPYPGVHVLYHRWQVGSRLETPAPFWVAGLRDGHGASYYTMGGRSQFGLARYYEVLQHSLENIRHLLAYDGVLVQLVAFSHAESQLPLYMDSLQRAGFEQFSPWGVNQSEPLTRSVPHRRWYTHTQQQGDAGSEVLLTHRLRSH